MALYVNGEVEIGFSGYLASNQPLDDETDGTVLEFTGPDGRSVGVSC